ncbi:LOW QUALITY PROTEIN: hypothetical protein PHMEG_00032932 [Phytophthora megakarya]|uniref:Uncharacterized protein n=1 Tax=Phytophthora megakarya TaxID=4795 RepID=A0A225UUE1_9STRA|nr:LOW QUALITY PROTEIN: hypothetical protein PHMEG_00032932 [Phytophthora megakarya]
MEEQRGAAARAAAHTRQSEVAAKKKRMPAETERAPAGSGNGKRERTTCPHASDEEDDDADNESDLVSSTGALDIDIPADVPVLQEEPVVVENTSMTSDVRVTSLTLSAEVENKEYAQEDGEADDGSDEVLAGAAILERQKKNAAKRLAAARLKEAVEKLPRNWQSTVDNWSLMTPEELSMFAQDPAALKKARADGWNCGTCANVIMVDILHVLNSSCRYIHVLHQFLTRFWQPLHILDCTVVSMGKLTLF